MEFWFLYIANGFFLLGFAYSLVAIRRGLFRPGRVNLLTLGAGFVFQSVYLYMRGQQLHACPLYSLFDVLVFLSWSIVLIYLVIGPAYRLSLLGAFTAPLVVLLQVAAFLSGPPEMVEVARSGPPNAWIELHGALSVMSYGAFGLAAVAALMFLVQERQLKRHQVSNLFYNLPPIQHLAMANGRLVLFGFLMLTCAFAAGFLSRLPVENLKFWAAFGIWALYGVLLFVRARHDFSPRRIAAFTVGIFMLAVVTLPAVHYLSSPGRLP